MLLLGVLGELQAGHTDGSLQFFVKGWNASARENLEN